MRAGYTQIPSIWEGKPYKITAWIAQLVLDAFPPRWYNMYPKGLIKSPKKKIVKKIFAINDQNDS